MAKKTKEKPQTKRVFKTKRVLSGVQTLYKAWKEWEEGDILIFKLVGTKQNRKAKNKVDWIVEVVEAQFADPKENKRLKPGTKVTLNTAGQFDRGMQELEVGDYAQVMYNGQQEMQGGEYEGQMAHLMEVTEMEEDDGSSSDDDEDEDDEDEESEDDEEDEDSEDDEDEDDL